MASERLLTMQRVDSPICCSCRSIVPQKSAHMMDRYVRNERPRQLPDEEREQSPSEVGAGGLTAAHSLHLFIFSFLFFSSLFSPPSSIFTIKSLPPTLRISFVHGALVALRRAGVIHPRTPTVESVRVLASFILHHLHLFLTIPMR